VASARHIMRMYPNIDEQDASGETPLHTAVRLSCMGMTSLLIAHGAAIHAMDADLQTPLARALQIRHDLLQWGGDYMTRNSSQPSATRKKVQTVRSRTTLIHDDLRNATWWFRRATDVKRRIHNSTKADEAEGEDQNELLKVNHVVIQVLNKAGGDIAPEVEKKYGNVLARRYFDCQTKWHEIIHSPVADYMHPIFQDPENQKAIEIVWKRVVRRKHYIQLLSWVVFMIFFMIFAFNDGGHNDPKMHQQHAVVVDTFVGEEWNDAENKNFHDVEKLEDLFSWIENVWIPKIYSSDTQYYRDGNVLHKSNGWFRDNLYFVGRPQMRQLRSMPTKCVQPDYDLPPCFYRLEVRSEDERHNSRVAYGPNSTWKYTSSKRNDVFYPSFLLDNEIDLPADGFIQTMPNSYTEALTLWNELKTDKFIDLNTRMLLFEACVANSNSALFSLVRLIIVHNSLGGFKAIPVIKTLKLAPFDYVHWDSSIAVFAVWAVLLGVYFAVEIQQMTQAWHPSVPIHQKPGFHHMAASVRRIYKAVGGHLEHPEEDNRFQRGLESLAKQFDHSATWPYFSWNTPGGIFNFFDFLVLMAFVVFIVLTIIQFYAAEDVEWDVGQKGSFADDVFWVGTLQQSRQHLLAVLLLFCWVKSLEYISLSKGLATMVRVFFSMVSALLWLILVLLLFLLAFTSFAFVSNPLKPRTSDFMTALLATFDGSIGNLTFDASMDTSRLQQFLYYCLFALLMVILVLNLIIAVMSSAYEEMMHRSRAHWAHTQLLSIVAHAESELDSEKKVRLCGFNLPCGGFWWPNLSRRYSKWIMPAKGKTLKVDCFLYNPSDDGDDDYDYTLLLKETRDQLLTGEDWLHDGCCSNYGQSSIEDESLEAFCCGTRDVDEADIVQVAATEIELEVSSEHDKSDEPRMCQSVR